VLNTILDRSVAVDACVACSSDGDMLAHACSHTKLSFGHVANITLAYEQIQADTLSHFIMDRASTFALTSNGDLTMLAEAVEASQIYLLNMTEVRFMY